MMILILVTKYLTKEQFFAKSKSGFEKAFSNPGVPLSFWNMR